jgi:hypothetical protein
MHKISPVRFQLHIRGECHQYISMISARVQDALFWAYTCNNPSVALKLRSKA